MRRVAFLACAETMPGAPTRREDAFEHDAMIAALRPAFAAAGMALEEVEWSGPLAAFDGIAAALLGTAWDYQDRPAEFLARLEALAARGIAVLNPPEVVRWNIDKRYLAALAERGAATIPTLWHEDAGRDEIAAALARFGCDSVVVKRQVGAGALGQHRFAADALPAAGWRMGHACMIQPFLPAIADEGEHSFVFVAGRFSHALTKRPGAGDYRIQSLYGGSESDWRPVAGDLAAAEAVIAALPFAAPAYARIDMVRLPDGRLAVMEAEMIEPFLYPAQGPGLGAALARVVAQTLAAAPAP